MTSLEKAKEILKRDGDCTGISCCKDHKNSCPLFNLCYEGKTKEEKMTFLRSYIKGVSMLKLKSELKRGDIVYVSDTSEECARRNKVRYIFLADVGGDSKYICAPIDSDIESSDYDNCRWRFVVPADSVKEMTLEEVCAELGYDIKIIKGDK